MKVVRGGEKTLEEEKRPRQKGIMELLEMSR